MAVQDQELTKRRLQQEAAQKAALEAQPAAIPTPEAAPQPPAQSGQGQGLGLRKMAEGYLGAPVAAAKTAIGKIGTDVANVGLKAINAEPLQSPDYSQAKGLIARGNEGAKQFADANVSLGKNLQAGLRSALGAREAQPAAETAGAQPASATDTPPAIEPPSLQASAPVSLEPSAPDATKKPTNNFQQTAVSGVVGRVGADGAQEFSNAPNDVTGAASTQMKAGRMGDGKGTFNVGEAGDSERAMAAYQRANEIRAQTRKEFSGGGLTVVGNSSDNMDRAAEVRRQQIATGLREQTPRMAMSMENNRHADARHDAEMGLRHRKVGQAEAGNASRQALEQAQADQAQQAARLTGMSAQSQERMNQLAQAMSDPDATEEQRTAAYRAYTALSTDPKDRYILQDEQIGVDAMGTPKYGKAAYDATTGNRLGAGQDQGQARSLESDLAQARRIIAKDPSRRDEIEKRLQSAYGRGLEN